MLPRLPWVEWSRPSTAGLCGRTEAAAIPLLVESKCGFAVAMAMPSGFCQGTTMQSPSLWSVMMKDGASDISQRQVSLEVEPHGPKVRNPVCRGDEQECVHTTAAAHHPAHTRRGSGASVRDRGCGNMWKGCCCVTQRSDAETLAKAPTRWVENWRAVSQTWWFLWPHFGVPTVIVASVDRMCCGC